MIAKLDPEDSGRVAMAEFLREMGALRIQTQQRWLKRNTFSERSSLTFEEFSEVTYLQIHVSNCGCCPCKNPKKLRELWDSCAP